MLRERALTVAFKKKKHKKCIVPVIKRPAVSSRSSSFRRPEPLVTGLKRTVSVDNADGDGILLTLAETCRPSTLHQPDVVGSYRHHDQVVVRQAHRYVIAVDSLNGAFHFAPIVRYKHRLSDIQTISCHRLESCPYDVVAIERPFRLVLEFDNVPVGGCFPQPGCLYSRYHPWPVKSVCRKRTDSRPDYRTLPWPSSAKHFYTKSRKSSSSRISGQLFLSAGCCLRCCSGGKIRPLGGATFMLIFNVCRPRLVYKNSINCSLARGRYPKKTNIAWDLTCCAYSEE